MAIPFSYGLDLSIRIQGASRLDTWVENDFTATVRFHWI